MVLTAFDSFLNNFFYSIPSTEPKPPMTASSKYDKNGELQGVNVQFALAGFKKDDVHVSFEGNILHVEGNNLKSDWVAEKFQCSFSRKISVKENLDLSKSKVVFDSGILNIFIPISIPSENKKTVLW